MQHQSVYITDYDMKRLRSFLGKSRNWLPEEAELLRKLKHRLDTAVVIAQKEAPPYLVTMHSHVGITDSEEQEEKDFWLVYPDEAMFGENQLSIISELAVSVLGTKVGDRVFVTNGEVVKVWRVAFLYYQPEASEHYKL